MGNLLILVINLQWALCGLSPATMWSRDTTWGALLTRTVICLEVKIPFASRLTDTESVFEHPGPRVTDTVVQKSAFPVSPVSAEHWYAAVVSSRFLITSFQHSAECQTKPVFLKFFFPKKLKGPLQGPDFQCRISPASYLQGWVIAL